MKRLITHGSGPAEEALLLTRPHLEVYAAKHGYELHSVADVIDTNGWSPEWSKIALLRELLPGSDECLWLDSDIIVRELDLDISRGLHDDDFQGLCLEHTPRGMNPNTGVWLLRNTPEAIAFLDLIWKTGPLPGATLHEQSVASDLLGFSYLPGEVKKPFRASPWLARTGWLHPYWNSLYIYQPEQMYIANAVHYAGVDIQSRLCLMRQHLISERLPGWESCLPDDIVEHINNEDVSRSTQPAAK